jgi:ribonuclease-3
MVESASRGAALDWKTSLQELTASLGLGVPEYRIDEAGPDHAKTFTAWVVVAGRKYGGVDGRSKKEAEQRAAEAAWRILSEQAAESSETTLVEEHTGADGLTHHDGGPVDGTDRGPRLDGTDRDSGAGGTDLEELRA